MTGSACSDRTTITPSKP